jgi:hypothetical protein
MYPHWDFWFDNKPSGNPDMQAGLSGWPYQLHSDFLINVKKYNFTNAVGVATALGTEDPGSKPVILAYAKFYFIFHGMLFFGIKHRPFVREHSEEKRMTDENNKKMKKPPKNGVTTS